ncbi:FadR/GntR family transcriptional regulator [Lentzea albidocapillata]|uniref:DNA-binding transcriptional regulator, FadR family n=2 Tax=Lentzea albidocapillata TaxID=40571 RepID=A0A1W2E193_9PSEU|nr:FadR/GntR family transcriptional regulator [Lentzea albidocapillata]SDM74361.1 transcriptional regulator, GntR family [Lentzea albidocapillata subsp. violacea]SMD03533.1 DNA-binding transcriptional regulator, FadR family [Lentzea albidocapillata]
MPLATTRRAGLVDQVIEQMRGAITTGEWPVGQRIPPEPELVTALGVGRNTVREAVRALSHAGLLEVRQGDGTFVRATSEISGAVRRMCGTELKEVLQVRRTLEMEGARLAAKYRTDAELARLTELLHKRDAAMEGEQWAEVIEHDTAFHVLLVQCSHNTLLAELYQGLTEAVKASVAASVDTSQPGQDQVSHTGLLHAVRDGDQEKAAIEAGGFFEELIEKFC